MNKVETECANCIFNLRDSEYKQYGCTFNRISKFLEVGTEIKTEHNSFVVGRTCNLKRDEQWSAGHNSKMNLAIIARSEVVKRTTLIVEFNWAHTLSNLKLFLLNVRNQKLAPLKVVISYNKEDNKTNAKQILDLLNEEFSDLPWKLELGKGVKSCCDKYGEADYLAFFFANDMLLDSFCSDIDNAVNENLLRVGLVLDDYGNAFVIHSDFWSKLNGDFPKRLEYQRLDEQGSIVDDISEPIGDFENKMAFLQKHDIRKNKWIFNWSEICPNQASLLS